MKKRFFTLLVSLLPVIGFAGYTNVVDFGDSLSDTGNPYLTDKKGNNNWVQFCIHGGSWCSATNPLYLRGAPVANETPDFGGQRANWLNYFDVQYGNGTVLPYRVYQESPAHYVDLNDQNLNFAYASAESGNLYVDDLHQSLPALPYNPYNFACKEPSHGGDIQTSCVPGLSTQIALYNQLSKSLDKSDQTHRTLYFVWSGGSDIFNDIGKLIVLAKQKKIISLLAGITAINQACINGNKRYVTLKNDQFSCPANNVAYSIKALADSGVDPKDIIVFNMADLRQIPAAYQLSGGKKAVLQLFHYISNTFNKNLTIMRNTLGLKDVRIYDTAAVLKAIMADPAKYHFSATIKQSQVDCVGPGGNAENCSPYVWYNSKHPSAHTGKCIANSMTLFVNGENPVTALKC